MHNYGKISFGTKKHLGQSHLVQCIWAKIKLGPNTFGQMTVGTISFRAICVSLTKYVYSWDPSEIGKSNFGLLHLSQSYLKLAQVGGDCTCPKWKSSKWDCPKWDWPKCDFGPYRLAQVRIAQMFFVQNKIQLKLCPRFLKRIVLWIWFVFTSLKERGIWAKMYKFAPSYPLSHFITFNRWSLQKFCEVLKAKRYNFVANKIQLQLCPRF